MLGMLIAMNPVIAQNAERKTREFFISEINAKVIIFHTGSDTHRESDAVEYPTEDDTKRLARKYQAPVDEECREKSIRRGLQSNCWQ